MHACLLVKQDAYKMLGQPVCPLSCVGCSLLEQKVDKMEAEVTKKMQERENRAQEDKRCISMTMDLHAARIASPRVCAPCAV